MTFDVTTYLDRKAAGQVTVAKSADKAAENGGTFEVHTPKFNPSNGARMPDIVTEFSMFDLEGRIIYYQTQIDNINALIADLKAL